MRHASPLLLLAAMVPACSADTELRRGSSPPASRLDNVPRGIASVHVVPGPLHQTPKTPGGVVFISPKAVDATKADTSFAEARALVAAGGHRLVASLARRQWDAKAARYTKIPSAGTFAPIARWANTHNIVIADECREPLPPVRRLLCRGHTFDRAHITRLVMLRSLRIPAALLRDHDLDWIAGLSKLEHLRISHNRLTSVSALAQLPKLRTLDVGFNPIQPPSLHRLLQHTALEALGVGGIDLPIEVWRVAQLQHLRSLVVRQSSFSDTDLREVVKRGKQLRSLDLSHTKVTRPGVLAAARGLSGLKELRVEGLGLSPATLTGLAKMKHLKARGR